ILICLLAAPRQVALAQASLFHSNTVQTHPVNLDFEQGTLGQLPEGWDSPSTGYVVRAEPPRPLTTRGLENLVAFTRLLGYVRHFHPSDEAAAADWNAFAIKAVDEVEDAKNAADLSQRL